MSRLSLADRKLPVEERVAKANGLVDGIFDDADIWGRLSQLKYAPKCRVRIEGIRISVFR
jgi:hypothetical protein